MMPTLRAEFKKLISIRSTYFWLVLSLLVVGIFTIYAEGFKNSVNLAAGPDKGSLFMASTIDHLAPFIGLFGGIIILLLMTHEYRYNTIIYTLTLSRSRSAVFLAKTLIAVIFTFVYAALMTIIGLAMIRLGLHLAHHALPHQDINYLTYLAKSVFFSVGYAMAAFVIAALIRNQVGSLATLLIFPGTIEGLLTLILKSNAVYLPFTALTQVVQAPNIKHTVVAHPARDFTTGSLTPGKGAMVFLCYLAASWLIAWYLFLRRDAV
jgi:ABC-type transport system involved in multi-copper enzyme maturation permease subunit